ncbi:prolyl endopeptidase-like [Protopterus annectens]|uniref:prolyl endopeptidase-like n=1 Tax=Protopterus annectens TaxID=7888 RepID=UPI001CFA580E|nr:prolyl endopeptidase-like [Protopterus annectens]
MKTTVDCCSMENWELIYSLDANSKLIDMEQFQSHCLLLWKNWGHLYLTAIPVESPAAVKVVKLPSWARAFEPQPNPVFSASSFSFQLSSPVQPASRFVYSLQENEICELKEDMKACESWDYCSICLQATSLDGTLVPITVFHKTLPKEMLTETPVLVHVYGAYGMDLNMGFKPENMLLLEENWILAYCHVRGGGELGLIWHEDGKLDKKHNGLNDLIACITQLHSRGYSNPGLTALTANSAGGVLAGALCNTAPHLVRAVVLKAPFLDVLNVMLDPCLPLTVEEREEWGDPLADRMVLEYIRSYCPYQNIKCQEYPSVIITSYENDQRVHKEGLLKYISKLRKATAYHAESHSKQESCSSNIILDMQPEGDHFGPTAWDDCLNEVAIQLAFLYKELGIEDRILKKKKKKEEKKKR